MHIVAILAMHGVVPFDLAIPCEIFAHVRNGDGTNAYEVRVCGEAPEIRCRAYGIRPTHGLEDLVEADTVIVPGIEDPSSAVPQPVVDAIRRAAGNGARLASICTGAFVLAATGLLDEQRAATHWIAAAELGRRYPSIAVDSHVLYIDNGRIITSAGASAGVDMCLHLVRNDHGQAAAAHAARLAVAPLDREGGQAQYIRYEAPYTAASLAPLLDWMRERIDCPLTIDQIAARAAMSTRTLNRRFKEQTGTTPLQWLLIARIRHAQELLETSPASIDDIAQLAGFESLSNFRERFRRVVGISPAPYRRNFLATGPR